VTHKEARLMWSREILKKTIVKVQKISEITTTLQFTELYFIIEEQKRPGLGLFWSLMSKISKIKQSGETTQTAALYTRRCGCGSPRSRNHCGSTGYTSYN